MMRPVILETYEFPSQYEELGYNFYDALTCCNKLNITKGSKKKLESWYDDNTI